MIKARKLKNRLIGNVCSNKEQTNFRRRIVLTELKR